MKVPKYTFSTILKKFLNDLFLIFVASLVFVPFNSAHGDLVLAEATFSPTEEVEQEVVAQEEEVEIISVNKPSAEEVRISGADSYPYQRTFVISAYYSPLPCQNKYTTGSYEGDIRLNGSGVNSADGTPVYPGMIAAPKAYPFGTKLSIPGLGMGAVHDRGGAIVSAGAGGYDRLDIWMGYGDEGLTRALNWGKRTVTATVYGVDSSIAESLTFGGFAPNEAVPKCGDNAIENAEENTTPAELPKVLETIEEVEPVKVNEVVSDYVPSDEEVLEVIDVSEELEADLSWGDAGKKVTELQEELITLNYLRGTPSGVYDDLTQHAVFKFQQANYLVADMNSLGAGVFGPKTRAKLNSYVASRNATNFAIAKNNFSSVQEKNVYVIKSELDFEDISPDVTNLQKFLKASGYFDYPYYTDYFGEVTKEAVIRFQLDHGIISSEYDLGAGRVGPKTLQYINTYNK